MKKILLLFVSLFSVGLGFAQQIGDGYAQTINSFNSVLVTGIYNSDKVQINYPYEIPDWPWKYLFAMRHSNPDMNCQFQLSSTFQQDDRVFFRKIVQQASVVEVNSEWQEFATRGVNTFNGTQRIAGDLYLGGSIGIATENPQSELDVNGTISTKRLLVTDGNVGIGTLDPQGYKLAVNGTIRAKEIKVDSDWADFVFKKDYKLPTLKEVETHINENGTLPGIPSESEVKGNGVNLAETNALLLQKIEELTLYIIQQEKRMESMEAEIKSIRSN